MEEEERRLEVQTEAAWRGGVMLAHNTCVTV